MVTLKNSSLCVGKEFNLHNVLLGKQKTKRNIRSPSLNKIFIWS